MVLKPTPSAFKVTPKDGIDDGGWAALRQLHMVVGVAVVLFTAVLLRVLAALGVVALPRLSGPPLVIGLVLGGWELALVMGALGRVTRRRQLRRHYRTPTEVAGIVGDDIVRVTDLTPVGAGLLCPSRIETGTQVHLVVDLPMVDGDLRLVHLELTAATCHPDPGAHGWRIGGSVLPCGDEDREALVEYCHVVATRTRLTESGRLLADAGGAQPGALPQNAPRPLGVRSHPRHAANSHSRHAANA